MPSSAIDSICLSTHLEAPALALLLAAFMRFTEPSATYSFSASENIPPFLFISVIVALFLGLSVSAEEILRDRSLLKRERFLQLIGGITCIPSWLWLPLCPWFTPWDLWPCRTSSWTFQHSPSNTPGALLGVLVWQCVGALISAIFQSAKVIYIVIPLLVIPQIIFGGAIVRFERFNPMFTQPDAVPWFGNVMASRWGFEALAVELARNNPFDDEFIAWEDRLYQAGWRRTSGFLN